MPNALDGDFSRSRAVLIGTWDYRYLSAVPAAKHSLNRMRDLLTNPICGPWPEDRITQVANRTALGDLQHELVVWLQDAVDVAFFYYVGHGQYDYDDRLCLSLGDSSQDPILRTTTSLTFEAVRHAFKASRATTKIAILDCCFAGLAVGEDGRLGTDRDLPSSPGFYLMMASGEYSTAWFETTAESRRPLTYFTKYLVDLLESGHPDLPLGLTLGPIFQKVADALVHDGKPTPGSRASDHASDFVFARNIAASFPARSEMEQVNVGAADSASTRARVVQIAGRAARVAATLSTNKDKATVVDEILRAVPLTDPAEAVQIVAETMRIAEAISKESQRASVLARIARAMATVDPAEGVRIADMITSRDEKEAALAGVAKTVAMTDPSAALRIVGTMTDRTDSRVSALAAIARVLVPTDPARARLISDEAMRIATRNTSKRWQVSALGEALKALAVVDAAKAVRMNKEITDQNQKAEEWAKKMAQVDVPGPIDPLADDGRKNSALVDIAQAAATTDPEQALRIAETIATDHYRASALAKVAQEAATAYPGEALRITARAVRIAENQRGKGRKASVLAGIADALAGVTQIVAPTAPARTLQIVTRAMKIAETNRQSWRRTPVPAGVADALAEAVKAVAPTDPNSVLQVATDLTDPASKAAALTEIAKALASTDPAEAVRIGSDAVKTASAMKDSRKLTRAMMAVAAADPEEAIRIAGAEIDQTMKASMVAAIAEFMAPTESSRAVHIAETITHTYEKAYALARIATVVAISDPTEAFRIAELALQSATQTANQTAEILDFGRSQARALTEIVYAVASLPQTAS